MRTDEEIVSRINAREFDLFGVYTVDLAECLPLESAKTFLEIKDVTKYTPAGRDPASVIARMREYMPFAIDKAVSHRGLSAGRSINHYSAWLWLLGDDELLQITEGEERYSPYGAPILAAISRKYHFQVPDTVVWQRMSRGDPCHVGCEEGCL